MIEEFTGEYRFLSNFWLLDKPMVYGGLTFKTNEHFYVACKTKDLNVRKLVAEAPTAGKVKLLGRNIKLREDWEEIKIDVMIYGLRYKFGKMNPVLRQKLLATGDKYIQEGNRWNDTFWGFNLHEQYGENHLGKLLMKVREEIKQEGN